MVLLNLQVPNHSEALLNQLNAMPNWLQGSHWRSLRDLEQAETIYEAEHKLKNILTLARNNSKALGPDDLAPNMLKSLGVKGF